MTLDPPRHWAVEWENVLALASVSASVVSQSIFTFSESRIYSCEFPGCGKEYKKRHHLKEHERKHTGDMKYKCEVCGKRFYIQG